MLKVAKLKANEVYTFKLSSGEEVLATYKGEEDGNYHLKKPMALAMTQDAEGNPSLGLTQFAATLDPSSNQEIPINTNAVITFFEPPAEIVKGYLERSSGIQLV